jgi:hypothetical protein
LFVSGDVLGLHPIFRLRRQAYSAYLDPWCEGICPVCFGRSARCASRLHSDDVFVSQSLVPKAEGAPISGLASREGGSGVAGW